MMTDNVLFCQVYEFNSVNVLENLLDFHQTGLPIIIKVDLGNITGNHCLGSFANPCQEHFHLRAGCVLGFIENNEGLIESAAPHESQGGYLNYTHLQQLAYLVRLQHIIQSIIDRSQVRVNLGSNIARKKTE